MTLPHRLFVVAAHPDDDTIGCGATMSLVVDAGGSSRVTYLSDGSRSHPGSRRFSPARVAKLRADEARAALAILAVREEPSFYGLHDGTLASLDPDTRAHTIERLAHDITAFSPDVVLAPWLRDPHPDHMACAAIAGEAVSSLERRPKLWWYEVWLPIRGSDLDRPRPHEAITHTIALDPAIRERKRRALLAHATQTTDLIDDDPGGFRIDDALVARWIGPHEILHESRVEGAHAG